MKTMLKMFFVIVLALPFAAAAQQIAVGIPAPDFSVTDVNGKAVSLTNYKNKNVILVLYVGYG